jgi:hypothetical protein
MLQEHEHLTKCKNTKFAICFPNMNAVILESYSRQPSDRQPCMAMFVLQVTILNMDICSVQRGPVVKAAGVNLVLLDLFDAGEPPSLAPVQ